jgi:hypothetical protein
VAPAAESPWRTVSPGGRSKAEVAVEPDIQETRPGPGPLPDTDSGMPALNKGRPSRKGWRESAGAATPTPPPRTEPEKEPAVGVVSPAVEPKPVKTAVYVAVVGSMVVCTAGIVFVCVKYFGSKPDGFASATTASTKPAATHEQTATESERKPKETANSKKEDTRPKNPWKEVEDGIAKGDGLFQGGSWDAALNQYQAARKQIRSQSENPQLWQRATLGAAKTCAETGDWSQVKVFSKDLPEGRKQALDELAKQALALQKGTPDLKNVLDRLDDLKSNPDLDQWGKEKAQKLGQTTRQKLLAQIDDVVEAAPEKPLKDLDRAFEQAKAIDRFDQSKQVEAERRMRATTLLRNAADKLRNSFNREKPLDPPYESKTAEKAFDLLQRAKHINGEALPEGLDEEMALAACYKLGPDYSLAANLKQVVVKGPERIPYLVVQAEAKALRAESKEAFECYAQILKLIDDNNLPVDKEVLAEQVLDKALERGEKACRGPVDDSFKARVAQVYDRKARDLLMVKEKKPWPEPQKDRIALLRKARELNPTAEAKASLAQECLDLSKEARSRGSASTNAAEKEKLLTEAADQAEDAAQADLEHAGPAYLVKGLALEELGRYRDAGEAFGKGKTQAGCRAGRGRCLCRQANAQGDFTPKFLAPARADLEAEDLTKLPGDQQVESLAWLGWICAYHKPPVYDKAKACLTEAYRLAKADGSFQGRYFFGLDALYQWVLLNGRSAASDPKDKGRFLEVGAASAADLLKTAKGRGQTVYEFRATAQLRLLGFMYVKDTADFDESEKPDKALAVFSQGLPGKDLSEADISQIPLLCERCNLFTAQKYQAFFERNNKLVPAKADLLRAADRLVELAKTDHALLTEDWKAEAYVAAARCYNYWRKFDKACDLMGEALKFNVPSKKKVYEALKAAFEKNKRDKANRPISPSQSP